MSRPRARHRSEAALRRTAIHEAGHAVIGRVLKQVCGGATIVPNSDEGNAGHTITADPYVTLEYWWGNLGRYRGDTMRSIMRGRIMTYMAGAEAEREFYRRSRGGDGYDRYQIALMLDSDLPMGADPAPVEARLRAFTRALVHRHRNTIERVAASLMERGTMEPDEINAAIGIDAAIIRNSEVDP